MNVALVQFRVEQSAHSSNLARAMRAIDEAANADPAPDVICLPECCDLGWLAAKASEFAEPGGGLSYDDLDRCRGDYAEDEYRGEACVMGVDPGRVLHVVIRECPPEPRVSQSSYVPPPSIPQHYIDTDTGEPPPGMAAAYGLTPGGVKGANAAKPEVELGRLVFAAEVATFEELDGLMDHFNVRHCVVDSQSEMHKAGDFAKKHPGRVSLARYGRQEPSTETKSYAGVTVISVNHTEIIDEMVERFRDGEAALPEGARELGGRVRQGRGEYYWELLAMKRVTEQDSRGNWVAHWVDGRKPDHYAHAEVYTLLAARRARRLGFEIVF